MKSGRPLHAPRVLCEAYDYPKPVPFSRGMRVDIAGATFIFISGTASVNEAGETVHAGDLGKQTHRTFANIKALLESEGATWRDVAHTRIYLRSMDRYHEFNRYRRAFLDGEAIRPYPASTCVEARLCRDDLLVEIEAIAICRRTTRPSRRSRKAGTRLETRPKRR
ncbi:MAG: RidA family protein [Nitrospirae bacterium]|nr:RidA family protein [Nitrospirota bacterium]